MSLRSAINCPSPTARRLRVSSLAVVSNEFVPDEIHAVTARLITETVDRLQEVLRYSHAPAEWEWPRMALYRLTDAQDTIGTLVGIYAAHVLRGRPRDPDALRRYMQISQQRPRTEMPQQEDIDYLDGLMGRPVKDPESPRYIAGQVCREHLGESDPHREWTLACIHALQAFACDEPDELDELSASIRNKARRVYATLT